MRLIDVLQLMHTAPTESSLCQEHNILVCETDRETHQHVSCPNCPIAATQKMSYLPRPHLLDDLK